MKKNKKNFCGLKVAIVYEKSNFKYNEQFAENLVLEFKNWGCLPQIFIVDKNVLNLIDLSSFEIIVNRSRLTYFLPDNKQALIFNDVNFSNMANNKFETYKWAKFNNINVLETNFLNKNKKYKYPIIVKETNGYGGNQVYKINNFDELDKINVLNKEYIVQDFFEHGNVDIRVYVMFKKILYAVKRTANNSEEFRANFSINKNVEKYKLNFLQKIYLKKIINKLPLGFYGIDFFLKNKRQIILNEIEDVVGSRALYHLKTNLNIPKIFVKNLLKNINNVKKWNDSSYI
ncbi:ATP-grasp domain-containing protein [Mycoplasmoides pirum]|uniref:ATP-grasp domain-containing protein n=1 Tax=Mycoplasmoides pirum TaxID=2122 RepID=UPI00047FDDE5|nr:ATP-grasp domain-containing protein [Mycoplasmoides pirum]